MTISSDPYARALRRVEAAECRRDLPEMAAVPSNLQRWTLKRLDEAYQGFFRRVKASGKSGFPRFRSKSRYDSFGFNEFSGIRFDGRRLRFKGMPSGLRVRLHRPLPKDADIRSCVFRRDGQHWHVCFQIAIAALEKRVVSSAVGLDLGLTTLAYLSDGGLIDNPRTTRHAEQEMRRRSRALARCKRGSKRRAKVRARVAQLHRQITNMRRTYLHQQSRMLVRNYDLIAIEALNVKGLAQSNLAKSVHDASWATLISMTKYKAEGAGAYVVEVDPKFTSQDCSGCGERVPKLLAQRTHHCPSCGLVLDRDHNAALNVLHRGVVAARALNVVGCDMRVPGNIASNGETRPPTGGER